MIDLALWILAGAAFLFLLSACWRVVLERSKLRCYAGLLLLSDDFREPQKAIFENWITGTRPIDTGTLLAIQSRANRLVLPFCGDISSISGLRAQERASILTFVVTKRTSRGVKNLLLQRQLRYRTLELKILFPHFHAAFPFSGEKLPQAKQGSPTRRTSPEMEIKPRQARPGGVALCATAFILPSDARDSTISKPPRLTYDPIPRASEHRSRDARRSLQAIRHLPGVRRGLRTRVRDTS
jgi:hypothetical protein